MRNALTTRWTQVTIIALTAALLIATQSPVHAAAPKPLKKGDRVVFLGDSITAAGARKNGFISMMRAVTDKKHADLKVQLIGAGISGHKVPDCQKRLQRDVIDRKPTIVFIYIGINDVWHSKRGRGTSKERFEMGLRRMIARINEAGARVILCTPTVIGEKVNGANKLDSMLDEYSDISRKVARDTKSQMLDLRKQFVAHLAKANKEKNKSRGVLTSDGVHLNRPGNRFVANLMLEALGVTVDE
ncbi:MAG: SGNH/GDSL hydrolase family protein [Planctomycetes bacterium]|nr:SGNH/GDSL hydrolase family protein [Planctomycetota bacterium]